MVDIDEEALELRYANCRVRVIQLENHLLRQLLPVRTVLGREAREGVLRARSAATMERTA